jgi:hypothetical protein
MHVLLLVVPAGPSRYKQILWKPARGILYFSLFVFVTKWTPLGWIDRIISNSTVAHLAKFVFVIFLLTLIFSVRDILAQLLSNAAWRTADYDRALQRLSWLSLGSPTAVILDMQAVTLSLAGRYRQALAKSAFGPRSDKVRLLCCLGDVLKNLGR